MNQIHQLKNEYGYRKQLKKAIFIPKDLMMKNDKNRKSFKVGDKEITFS